MSREKRPVTPAIRALRAAGAQFVEHHYDYVDKGGTGRAAACLAVNEHRVIKTLVMEDDGKRPLIVLMHGDRQVSTKQLARTIGSKSVAACSPERAQAHTGYVVGGTSPLGTRKRIPVYVEASILDLDRIYLNAGSRGYLVELHPQVLRELLDITPVTVGISP